MTEYDYSPEAYERYLETQARIAKWVDHAETKRAEFTNPFVPAPRSDLDEDEVRNDFYNADPSRSHRHRSHHKSSTTSPNTSSSSINPSSSHSSSRLTPQPVAHAYYPQSQWYILQPQPPLPTPPGDYMPGKPLGSTSNVGSTSPTRPSKLRRGNHSSGSHPYNGYTSQANPTATQPIPVIPSPNPVYPSATQLYAPQHRHPQNVVYPAAGHAVVPAAYPAAVQYQYHQPKSATPTHIYIPSTVAPYSVLIPQASR
ncbi:hypothetical protein AX16_008359 [Volvariella volvacea WC 439]|nr:hypothetical protein AX16_008359 [Volvariella volvacea WC 439]